MPHDRIQGFSPELLLNGQGVVVLNILSILCCKATSRQKNQLNVPAPKKEDETDKCKWKLFFQLNTESGVAAGSCFLESDCSHYHWTRKGLEFNTSLVKHKGRGWVHFHPEWNVLSSINFRPVSEVIKPQIERGEDSKRGPSSRFTTIASKSLRLPTLDPFCWEQLPRLHLESSWIQNSRACTKARK